MNEEKNIGLYFGTIQKSVKYRQNSPNFDEFTDMFFDGFRSNNQIEISDKIVQKKTLAELISGDLQKSVLLQKAKGGMVSAFMDPLLKYADSMDDLLLFLSDERYALKFLSNEKYVSNVEFTFLDETEPKDTFAETGRFQLSLFNVAEMHRLYRVIFPLLMARHGYFVDQNLLKFENKNGNMIKAEPISNVLFEYCADINPKHETDSDISALLLKQTIERLDAFFGKKYHLISDKFFSNLTNRSYQ